MIVLPTDQSNYDNGLECPKCGGNNLHHEEVTMYSRLEDDTSTTVTSVEVDGDVNVTQMKSQGCGNPSTRRHGLRVRFSCEMCGEVQDLCIAQHKGTTFMYWDGK